MKRILIVLSVLFLVSCATTQQFFGSGSPATGQFFSTPITASSNSVVVYVYRPSGYAYQPDVIINNVNKSLLAPGAYLVSVESVERIQIVVQKNPSTGNWNFNPIGTSTNAKFGQTRFFRINANVGFGVFNTQIEEVAEAVALREMLNTRSMK